MEGERKVSISSSPTNLPSEAASTALCNRQETEHQRTQHLSSTTEKTGESAETRPEASWRATLWFQRPEERYQLPLHSPEPRWLGRAFGLFRMAVAAQRSAAQQVFWAPRSGPPPREWGRLCAARGGSWRRTHSPHRTESEVSYLKAANRGQPAPHGGEEKTAERTELPAHGANPLCTGALQGGEGNGQESRGSAFGRGGRVLLCGAVRD